MWVLSIPLHGNEDVVVRHLLRPGKTYKIGRAEGNDFLLSKQSISKLHLEIRVGGFNSSSEEAQVEDVGFLTPVTIVTSSKATTELNRFAFKASPESPRTIQITERKNILRLGSLKREFSQIELHWVDVTVGCDDKSLTKELYRLATQVDFRIPIDMARKLTFFVASKVDSIATARALLLQTPMVTTEFLGKLDPEKLEHNFDKNMPRMSDFVPDEQYMPDEKRRRLFENVRVIVKTESLHLSLSHVLEGLNAEIINYEDGMNLENAILVSSNPLDGFADLQMLIQAIKNVDLDYVQPRARPTRRRIMAEYTVQDTLDVMFGGEVADTKKVQVPSSQPVFDSNESVPASNDKGEADSEVLQQEEAVSSEKKVLTAQATSLKHKHNIAEAIRMTKQIRKESQQKDSQILTGPDSLEEPKISVTVEPAILIRPQKVSDGHQDRVSHNGNVKNFKRFRKTGKKCTGGQWDGSRVFLNLVEFNVNPNSISTKDKEFLEGFAESFNESIQDLDKQMQPQKSLHTKRRPQQAAVLIGKKPRSATPLFVEEDDDIETNSVAGISPGMSINDNDDDHTPKFRFSRG